MEQNNKKKTLILSILGVLLLIGSVIGITYSFFNYTRTGTENTIKTGNISFNSTQDNTISLTNVFPTSSTNLNNTNSDTVTINITGDTTYSEGIEYKVTLDQVNNTINGKEVPISYKAIATNLGTEDSNYYTNRENKTNIYKLNPEGEAYNGKYIAVGYIPSGEQGVNGGIDITAFIDINRVAISDTYPAESGYVLNPNMNVNSCVNIFARYRWDGLLVNSETLDAFCQGTGTINGLTMQRRLDMGNFFQDSTRELFEDLVQNAVIITSSYNGTTYDWVGDRIVFTTTEWNSFQTTPLSFKVKVEANEGKWVEPEGYVTLKNLNDIQEWKDIRANVTSIEFHKDGVIPANYVTSFDVTDSTSENNITLYTVDDQLGTNTYKAIVVANDTIYAPESSGFLFSNMVNLKSFNSENFRVDNVVDMGLLFASCQNLNSILEIENWNVEKVKSMNNMFRGCVNLKTINLSNWKTSSLIYASGMFEMMNNDSSPRSDSKLETIILSDKFDTSHVIDMSYMFYYNVSLNDYSFLQYFDTSNVMQMDYMFTRNYGLLNLDYLINWNVENVSRFVSMFSNCTNLVSVTAINDWNIKSDAICTNMFKNVPVHPEFTKVQGTWSNGTFTPNA